MTEPAKREAQRPECLEQPRASSTARRRLFFALGLDEVCRARLLEVSSGLLEPLAGLSGRALAPMDWHVTLCFLGAVEEALLGPLCAQAALIGADAFSLRLTRVAYWREAQVIAALAAAPPPAALQLVSELRTRSRALGLAPDEKPMKPHVTLMRVAARQWRRAGADAPRAVPVDLILPAREFQLLESRAPPPREATREATRGAVRGAARGAAAVGTRYVELARWPLRA
jgi:RNA 2',3'-cyclic 3'-phosphodiesterase